MLRDGIKIWLRNPSVAVPFLIHNFVRYGILLALILYIMIKTGSFSILEISEHLSVGIAAIGVTADLIVEGYFISAEIRACYDAIEGELNLDRAFKLALKILPSMLAILFIVAISTIPIVLFWKNPILIAICSIYLTVLAITFTFAPFAVVIDGLNPVKSIVKSISIVKLKIGRVLAMWTIVGIILIAYALILKTALMFNLGIALILNLFVFPAIVLPLIFIWWTLLYIR